MLAGVVSRFGEVRAEEVPMPEMGDYDALVKIAACAFCNGTDRQIIEGTFPFLSPLPVILGHESVGEVVEVGSKVQNYKRGDLVFRPAARYKDVPGASPVVMVGRRDERLKQTMDFGVDSVINSAKEDVVQRARELSGGSFTITPGTPSHLTTGKGANKAPFQQASGMFYYSK